MNPKQIVCAAALAAAALPGLAGDRYYFGPPLRAYQAAAVDQAPGTSFGVDSLTYRFDRLLAKYRIRPYLAITSGPSDFTPAAEAEASAGWAASWLRSPGAQTSALGGVQINESLTLFGRLGVGNDERAGKPTSIELPVSESGTVFRTNNGGGATYTLSNEIGVRLEYERFKKLDDASSIRLWSIAFHLRH